MGPAKEKRSVDLLLAALNANSRPSSPSLRAHVDSVICDSKSNGDEGPRAMKAVNQTRPGEKN